MMLSLALGAVVLNAALAVTSRAFVAQGWLPSEAAGTGVGATRDFITLTQGTDSWMPMLRAIHIHEAGQPIYDTLFFAEKVKFQYPLTALLPVVGLRKVGVTDESFPGVARMASWLAVWATIGVSIAIYFTVRRRAQAAWGLPVGASPWGHPVGEAWMAALALGIAGLSFYPLVKGFALGQIQTFLTLFFAIACYCWLRGKERAAGALIGLMILVKPHYAFIGLWFALRKRFGALWAAVGVVGGGLAVAVAVFGWSAQIKYLDVIREASRGESYFSNLSFNGVANRLLGNGPNLSFDANAFAPYHPLVFATTVLSAVVLVGAALVFPRKPGQRGRAADFCAVTVAATAASPIAWEHHYGILFPVFAMVIAAHVERREITRILVAYTLVANAWTPFNVFSSIPAVNVLQSACLAGVVLTLVVLWRQRRQDEGPSFRDARGRHAV